MFNRVYHDTHVDDNPYIGLTLSSKFYDIPSLSSDVSIVSKPIYLSINIQSLQSKYEQLLAELSEMENKGIYVEIIALQEIWDVRYPELYIIPGFKPIILKKRQGMRGGGVGFYIRDNLNAKIIENLSPFENKIIEALTIQLSYPDGKQVLLSCVYRSNGILHNVTQAQQLDRFMNSFAELLSNLQSKKLDSYLFIDSNIDLLNLRQQSAENYMNLLLEKSFLQVISKATRIQNQSKSLIDHILFNVNCLNLTSGTLISDISDHFFTFVVPPARYKNPPQTHKSVQSRNYSLQNLNNFKTELSMADWTNVTSLNDANLAYNEFWKTYEACHNANFPFTRQRFNKNFHKKQLFMTQGLLVSRNTKNRLHKLSISNPEPATIQCYKTYKTLYLKTVRAAKKLYFTSKLDANAGNPKKTWETLNEILGKPKKNDSVSQININEIPESDPTKIANHFNTFFTSIGKKNSNDIPPVQNSLRIKSIMVGKYQDSH